MEDCTSEGIDPLSMDTWDAFDSIEYVERNYGGMILPEDEEIIRTVITGLELLGVSPTSLERVADIGSGPNFYPAMLLASLLKPDNKMDLIEYAQPNIDFMRVLLSEGDHIYKNINKVGIEQSIDTHYPWGKFDALIADIGGKNFQDTFNRARIASRSIKGNIHELPKFWYDLVSSYFVAESITTDETECVQAISSVVQAVRPGGWFIFAVMVGSKGYPAGENTHFPAANLSVEDFRRIFTSISGIEYELIPTSVSNEKLREGYHGMAVILGTRINSQNPHPAQSEESMHQIHHPVHPSI
ncbi:hypothetical protein [Ktedonobacter robiniae]|uniref:Methyltransferase n=1 Tax=Ktedonobacter robiniae TaxID=2778365 RepID=A0ABQ3V7I3_9CHLR|nr:hypothetical protein [Ktedonobacter robiniae]GHO60928.1 hypothetical protein KSB_94030 [Ktedonobacter robiniae]